jgi:hypothetical protein
MQQRKSVDVELSPADIEDAIKTYLTTPRVRRTHKLPVCDRENITVQMNGGDGASARLTVALPNEQQTNAKEGDS